MVAVGDGSTTAFWLDSWLGQQPLCDRFPALYSHTTRPHAQLLAVLDSGLTLSLTPRLSSCATSELASLITDLQLVRLDPNVADSRRCKHSQKVLTNKSFYANNYRLLQTDDLADMVWKNAAPLKCRIFNWLVRRQRLPTNDRRFRHQLGVSPNCAFCSIVEDTDHLLVCCPRAREVWDLFYPSTNGLVASSVQELWAARCGDFVKTTICTAISWNIWKRRNAKVFNNVYEPLDAVKSRCMEDIRLWAYRCKSASAANALKSWCLAYEPP